MKLNEIAPLWAEALKIYKIEGYEKYVEFSKKHDLRIGNGARCIVGEAWGWNVKYMYWDPMLKGKEIGCRACNDFSGRFLSFFHYLGEMNEFHSGYAREPQPGHEQVIALLEDHWCEKHSK